MTQLLKKRDDMLDRQYWTYMYITPQSWEGTEVGLGGCSDNEVDRGQMQMMLNLAAITVEEVM